MNAFALVLSVFSVLSTFLFVPDKSGTLVTNLYNPRLLVIPIFAVLGLFWVGALRTRSMSIITYIKTHNPSRYFLLVTLYIIWLLLCSILSAFPGYAFLGMYELQFGSVLIISSIAISFLYSNFSYAIYSKISLYIITILAFSATLVESIGFRPFLSWIHSKNILYPSIMIGDRPHLAGLFAVLVFTPVLFYRNRAKTPLFWSWLLAALAGIALTSTSSAVLGTFLGLLVWFFSSLKMKQWKTPLFSIFAACILIVGLPPATRWTAQTLHLKTADFKNLSSTSSLRNRFYLWEAAFNGAVQHPVFGWGDETFAFHVFDLLEPNKAKDLFRIELGISKDYEVVYKGFTYYISNSKKQDRQTGSLIYVRAHNIVFDEMYSHGILGFLIWVSIIIYSLVLIWQQWRKDFWIALCVLTPYGVYLLGWFYVPTVTPLYFIVIGCMVAALRQEKNSPLSFN